MLGAKTLHFLSPWKLMPLILVICAAALARAEAPQVEISAPPPLEFELDSLRADDWPARSQPVIDRWLNEHYEEMAPDDSTTDLDLKITSAALGKLISHGAGIGHELLSANDAVASYSHYRFLREVKKDFPRVAWVAMVDRTRYNSRHSGAMRYSGDIGLQFAVLGSPELTLKDGQGQLVVRMLPFGANQEKATVGFYRGKRLRDTDAARLEPTSAVEAEGMLKWGDLQPGVRVRLQRELESGGELRALSEVYLKVDIKKRFDDFREISIVPRCMWDHSWGEHDRTTQLASSFAKGYEKLHSIQICTLNIRFRYGKWH